MAKEAGELRLGHVVITVRAPSYAPRAHRAP
jgi:hypothetical protein